MGEKVWLVYSYDLGGNSGSSVQGVFTSREKAEAFAAEYQRRWRLKWPNDSDLFEIEEEEVDPEVTFPDGGWAAKPT